MYSQYVPVNRLQRDDAVVQEQIRQRLDFQQYYRSRYGEEAGEDQKRQKVIIVANRLPITLIFEGICHGMVCQQKLFLSFFKSYFLVF